MKLTSHTKFLRSLFAAFLTSPWGLIVPLTGTALLLGCVIWTTFLASNPALFWDQFDATTPRDLAEKLESFAATQELTFPVLAAGIGHKREAIHTFCRQRLLTWVATDASFAAYDDLKRCERLATYLSDMSPAWGPSGKHAAAEIARTMLHRLTSSPSSDRDPRIVTRISDACVEVIGGVDMSLAAKIQSQERSLAQSRGGPPSEWNETVEEMLAATEWREKKSTSQFATAAPETMLASRDAAAARQALASAFARRAVSDDSTTTLVASQNIPATIASHSKLQDELQGDTGQTKFARRFTPLAPPKRRPADFSLEPVELTPLGGVAIDDVLQCSPPELMRLLHHPSGMIRQKAEEILVSRDHLTPELLRLAYRLYHPDKAIRLELTSQLPGVIGVKPIYWWDTLAADPHPDVRYAAISFLATLQDPQIKQRVAELSRADSDPRISRIGLR